MPKESLDNFYVLVFDIVWFCQTLIFHDAAARNIAFHWFDHDRNVVAMNLSSASRRPISSGLERLPSKIVCFFISSLDCLSWFGASFWKECLFYPLVSIPKDPFRSTRLAFFLVVSLL
jgi:hypothetical protein